MSQAAGDVATNQFSAHWTFALSATNYLLDVSTTNDFTTYVSGYEAFSVETNVNVVTGLSAGVEYYYRVRAQNSSGQSDSSATQSVWTLPAAPEVLAATNNAVESFDANWNAVLGATNYLLDVSLTNDFSSYVAGYSNQTVGTLVSRPVSGLSIGTEYYYRLQSTEQQRDECGFGDANRLDSAAGALCASRRRCGDE